MRPLSPHFTLAELTRSSVRLPNDPDPLSVARLTDLCASVLEPLRDTVGAPVIVLSGYRSPAVNKAIRGAKDSQHQRGEAADIIVQGLSNFHLAATIADWLPFDQLILEFVGSDGFSGWVHVSYRSTRLRREILAATIYDGRTVYQKIERSAIPTG